MPEKMKIYNKDGSTAVVDAVDGVVYVAKHSKEWADKPWPKTDKADADAAAKKAADDEAAAKAKAEADAKAKADADAKQNQS